VAAVSCIDEGAECAHFTGERRHEKNRYRLCRARHNSATTCKGDVLQARQAAIVPLFQTAQSLTEQLGSLLNSGSKPASK
jgi:hypothetical protein